MNCSEENLWQSGSADNYLLHQSFMYDSLQVSQGTLTDALKTQLNSFTILLSVQVVFKS